MKAPAPDVYQHEMPGGQYTNLKQQARNLGLEDRWPEVCRAYATSNQLFGDIVKVTPSSRSSTIWRCFSSRTFGKPTTCCIRRRRSAFPAASSRCCGGCSASRMAAGRDFQDVVLRHLGCSRLSGGPARRAGGRFRGRRAKSRRRRGRPAEEERSLYPVPLYPQVFLDLNCAEVRRHVIVPTANFFFGMQSGGRFRLRSTARRSSFDISQPATCERTARGRSSSS